MTFEELKAEADRQGYRLVKREPYVKTYRCPKCGNDPVPRRGWVFGLDGREDKWVYFCYTCNIRGEAARTKQLALINWNEQCGKEKQ
jgi:transcription elongation factor Elf1